MDRFHYKSCGLDNVYLLNGYQERVIDGVKAVSIHDQDGLHRTIAQQLIEKPAPLTGDEFRFLRIELDLSQKALADLLDVQDQTVAKWEKGQTKKVRGMADVLMRALARERLLNQHGPIYEFLCEMSRLDNRIDDQRIELRETDDGWQPTRAA